MDFRDDIADLETEIDTLAEAAERCRKIMIVAKMAVAAGIMALSVLMLGIVRSDALLILTSVTAVLAGIAIFGSHRSTLQELNAKISRREADRSVLIDSMGLHVMEREETWRSDRRQIGERPGSSP